MVFVLSRTVQEIRRVMVLTLLENVSIGVLTKLNSRKELFFVLCRTFVQCTFFSSTKLDLTVHIFLKLNIGIYQYIHLAKGCFSIVHFFETPKT